MGVSGVSLRGVAERRVAGSGLGTRGAAAWARRQAAPREREAERRGGRADAPLPAVHSDRVQSAMFHSSESQSEISMPPNVLACADTPPRWIKGMIE